MSVQFGKCNLDGKPVDPEDLDEVRPVLAPYGPDGEGFICKNNLAVLYRAFHITRESRREVQPHVMSSGSILAWDGQLDNRVDLICQIGGIILAESTDVEIVAAAYERWGTESFAKLIGDWAASISDPISRTIILARDFVGTRQLYYSIEKDLLTWCSILDPLILLARRCFELEEEYVAGWLSFFPSPHLTPYAGIRAVPPSSFVRFKKDRRETERYWDFNGSKRIRYSADPEYEEHFRWAFGESVRRRLRSDSPVLAELSGGMDSSSIVCMADKIIQAGCAETSRLDTISYYADSEPNWDERPYFTAVEQKLGRTGVHIDVRKAFAVSGFEDRFSATPASMGSRRRCETDEFAECLSHRGNRVVLSGIGGDEVLGGVPTPTSEILDLLSRARIAGLARQLKEWALDKKKPWFYLLLEALQEILPRTRTLLPRYLSPPAWLDRGFARKHWVALVGYAAGVRIFGSLPSFQKNIQVLNGVRRQLGCFVSSPESLHDKCYPYLDRDLLEFLFAIPREQILRPRQRRSLMRRSLKDVLPELILHRKRKAFLVRTPSAAASLQWASLIAADGNIITSVLRIVDATRFAEAVEDAASGREMHVVPMQRALALEAWFRSLKDRKVLELDRIGALQPSSKPTNNPEDITNPATA